MEDVLVEKAFRGRGYGHNILDAVIANSHEQGHYKLIGTSRFGRESVHRWYERHGFKQRGIEFRLDL